MSNASKSSSSVLSQPISPSTVRIVEVSPRDGLQNIPDRVPTPIKLSLIARLLATGLETIELTSFVSPRAIPQLADCREVLSDPSIKRLLQRDGRNPKQKGYARDLRLPVLVPNGIGLKNALELDVKEVAVFVSAGEGFSQANINCTVQEGLNRAKYVAERAIAQGLVVRGYVSCIFTDPFDGPVPQASVLNCVRQLLDIGCYEISLGDTLGVGVAQQVKSLMMYLIKSGISVDVLAGHFHDTYGQAVNNVSAAYQCGVRVFDSSVAGLGGCPFAPGARGNVATEDLVYMFHGSGISTGVDLLKLVEVGLWISKVLNKSNGSRAGSALATKHNLLGTLRPVIPTEKHTTSNKISWSPISMNNDIKIYQAGTSVKIVLDRPRKGNTLTIDMCEQLTSFFRKASSDLSVKSIVITANGKFFCTGMDLGKNTTAVSKGGSSSQKQFQALTMLFSAIDSAPQTTIACIQGPAFGGGVGLAFACDIRLVVKTAVFTLSEVKLGLCPATISKYIIREWGLPFAREGMLSGRPISPHELLSLGVVASVEEDTLRLSKALDAYLLRLDGCAPRAAAMCKELIRLAWVDPGGKKQAEGIELLFEEMMAEDAEAAYGVKEFQAGNRSINWSTYDRKEPKSKL